jgi:hypothetical protein
MRAVVHNDDGSNNDNNRSNNTINTDEEANEFGTELGGWCCSTNSLPIVYLRMWPNNRPNLTSFVSRKIPDECQLDTNDTTNNNQKRKMSAAIAVQSKPNNKQKKSPSESIAEAFTNLIQWKQNEVKPSDLSDILRGDVQSYMQSQSTKERIDLLEKQISVLQRRIQSCDSEEQRDHYSLGLKSLEAELDNLVMPPYNFTLLHVYLNVITILRVYVNIMTIFRLQLCFVNCGQHYIVVAYDRLILVAVRQLEELYGICCLLHRVDLGTQYSLGQNRWDLDQLNLPP